ERNQGDRQRILHQEYPSVTAHPFQTLNLYCRATPAKATFCDTRESRGYSAAWPRWVKCFQRTPSPRRAARLRNEKYGIRTNNSNTHTAIASVRVPSAISPKTSRA